MTLRAKDNPFRSERVLEFRYCPLGWHWGDLMPRLAAMGYRAALVGPQGSGKTTLLEDLRPRLASIGFTTTFLRLDVDSPGFERGLLERLSAETSPRHIILLDGCEQLPPLAWRRFLRRTTGAGGVIVTTHEPGRLPTLVECQTNEALLVDIVRALAGPAMADGFDLSSLFVKHRGNIREALRELYDCCGDELKLTLGSCHL